MTLRQAYFAPAELVPADQAVGRVSADSLAAYPPGIPNVMPGEILTADVLNFLRCTAASLRPRPRRRQPRTDPDPGTHQRLTAGATVDNSCPAPNASSGT